MCGIAGWFSPQPSDVQRAEPVLARMLQAIRHRGPDGEGRLFLPHAVLGHARLSIIDLQGGSQPMQDMDARCHLVFNGEIYNYRELRSALAVAGYPFRTQSDSEVILAVYRHYGIEGFSRLRGMFAFVLWDSHDSTAYLVRDLCGIKPLFHATDHEGRLIFGSEAKAVLASGWVTAALDENHLHEIMNFRYILGEGSLFKGVGQVPHGAVMQWTAGSGLQHHSWLKAGEPGREPILATLRDSVHAHLVADVEVGVHLSGGVDSAAILALATERSRLRTFTLAIGDDAREAENAAVTARSFGAENHCEAVGLDVATLLPKLVWHMEMPKVNALQVYLISGVSARHVKVVLSGMGGDELFYGYNVYRILWQFQPLNGLARLFGAKADFKGFTRSLMARGYEWNEYDRMRAMLGHGGNWPLVYGLIRNVWDCPAHREWIYGPRMLDNTLDNAFDSLEQRWPRDPDPVAAARRFEWNNKLVNDLLWQEDRCSMAHGIESRVPFVDARVAANTAGYTRKELMPCGKLKWRMRQQLSEVIPREILQRRKSGFQVDSPSFFHQHLSPLARTLLNEDKVRQHGLFNPAFVRFLLQLPVSQRYRWHYFMLYLMIGSHLWLDLFEGKADCP